MEIQNPQTELTPRSLSIISWISGLTWIVTGFLLITFFHQKSISELILSGQSIPLQLITGIISGAIFGRFGILMMQSDSLRQTLSDYAIMQILQKTPLSRGLILQISLIAGITEEFLFRAAIQPLIGIWATSLLFIAVHGYIRFKTVNHFLFTVFTFVLSMMLGYLFILFGLISAITAHVIYDYMLLSKWKYRIEDHSIT